MAIAIVPERVIMPVSGLPPVEAYLAHPEVSGPYAAAVVGMELFGVTSHIRNVTNWLAANGTWSWRPTATTEYSQAQNSHTIQSDEPKVLNLLHQVSREDALQDV